MTTRRSFLGGALASAWAAAAPATPKIDIHVHLGRNNRDSFSMTREKLAASVKFLLAEMDRNQVEKSLIVAVEPVFPTELYLEAAKMEPQRLLACCSLMPRPTNQALDKLKAYRDRGARALKLQPMQYDPHDPAVERVVYEAVRLGMPVLFHQMDLPKSFPDMLNHFATTFPDGNFVVVHFGGVYGFWDVLPLARLPNVYLETSSAFPRVVKNLKNMLQFLVEENRLNKLVFGSELPIEYPHVFAAIDELLGPDPKPETVEAVYRGNAKKLLQLD